jgi:hypothetical protein
MICIPFFIMNKAGNEDIWLYASGFINSGPANG